MTLGHLAENAHNPEHDECSLQQPRALIAVPESPQSATVVGDPGN